MATGTEVGLPMAVEAKLNELCQIRNEMNPKERFLRQLFAAFPFERPLRGMRNG